ncbi:hypothetical protein HUG17_3412 [Dermatophagoides farinae]|uniref:Inositol polyphosphate-related phosphatase domain-containing protein n=3 Tax=Dermatophagoides farinae TaxID=6954 RepID=A0A9D4NW46_DERFA|nr:hypothetical protein HUG17_3412 [Dermatophagoides farinae]
MNEMTTFPFNEQTNILQQQQSNEQNFFALRNNRIVHSPVINDNHLLSNNNNNNNGRLNRKTLILRWIIILISILSISVITIAVAYFILYDTNNNNIVNARHHHQGINMNCKKSFSEIDSQESNKREQELVNSGNYLSIYFVTYNVASKEPSGSFAELFALYHRRYDAYAIVLEEMPMKTFLYIDGWRTSFEQLFRQIDYVLLRKESSIFTGVFLFVRRRDIDRYSYVQTYPVKIQSDRAFAFKGAVGLRFIYNKVQIAIIGAHLTPHDENYQKRIKDIMTIMSEVYFSNYSDTVSNQDITFLFGDLNFRLNPMNEPNESYNEAHEFESITQFIRENQNNSDHPDRYESLLKYDQIRYAIHKGEAIKDYEESPITFAPTFKFVLDSCDQYDRKRRPAWTDRILWRNLLKIQSNLQKIDPSKVAKIEPIVMYYDSIPQYTLSDHKPVRQLVWIPIMEMKQLKKDLARQRRDRRRLTLPSAFDKPPVPHRRLRSDSATSFVPRTMNEFHIGQEPMAMLSNEISTASSLLKFEIDKDWWPNVDDPGLFEPSYRIEFYHIPDWNQTKKFYVHFRILSNNDDDDHDRRPVSIRDPSVKRFLNPWDWVGLFPENFTSLDDFLTFSYPKFGNALPTEQAADALSMLNIDDDNHDETRDSDPVSQQGDQQLNRDSDKETSSLTADTDAEPESANHTDEVFPVYFDESIPILAGRYLLVYVRHNGDVIGISEPFQIERDIDMSSDIQ